MAARYEILASAVKTVGASGINVVASGSAQIKDLSGNNLTVYQAETGATTVTNPITTDSAGRIEGWVEAPDFDIAISDSTVPAHFTSYTLKVRQSPAGTFNVKSYGARGDGTTDDTAAVQAAITAANSASGVCHFPGLTATYLTTDNITDFHTTRKSGPGAVKRNSSTFPVEARTGDTNTIYCSASGTGDGLSSSYPASITDAASWLAYYASPLRGTWTLSLAAGSYPGVTFPRAIRTCDDYLYIVGPTVAHPSEPTAIIDHAEDTSKTKGLDFFDYMQVRVKYVETKDFSTGLQAQRHCTVRLENVWDRGSAVGRTFSDHVGYTSIGGYLIDNTTMGVQELFHVHRDYAAAGSTADGTVIQNTGSTGSTMGLQAKEWCNGHMDYLTVEDCGAGIVLHTSTANIDNLTLNRNGIGIVPVNSELHDSAIVWGTGADANTQKILPLGNSSEIWRFGWNGSVPVTNRLGHRPLLPVKQTLTDTTWTGFTAETTIFSQTYEAGESTLQGMRRRMTLWGIINTLGATQYRLLVRMAGSLGTEVDIPASSAGSFYMELEVITTADGNSQIFVARLMGETYNDVSMARRTIDLTSTARTLAVSAIPAAGTDSITIKVAEAWG